ncbi:MAG: PTS sugar transporter subunit IIA [Verrucomicrobia bacterium]|nr:PTS sugar transporter subunit IIA [Verrucomicrobiota bacterium]
MQKVINDLVQLQELTIARAQQAASMPGARLTELESAIESMQNTLKEPLRTQFLKLQKRDMLAIVPLSNQVCTACGMSLPVSFVQSVRQAERIHQCPSCARLVYFRKYSLSRIPQKRARRGEPPKVGIERFSAAELMIPSLEAKTRDDALLEICRKLEAESFVEDSDKLHETALKREAIISTAVDHGLAFPHVREVEGGGLTLALGISKKGIKFGGPGRTLTRIIFFMVIPTSASAFYLKLLSGLTQTFREADNRDKLLAAETPESLWKALLKTTKATIQ